MNPKEQTYLFGHEQVEADLLNAWKMGRLPHSILLTGPKGVGRASLAFRLAKFLLSNSSDDATTMAIDASLPVVRRIISGGHGDLQVIEPDPEKATKEITVDQVRQIKHFLSQTPMEGGWRIVVVDGEMNRGAANAVLKVLEEPPKKSLLIIMSESAGRVLPTIRSRCHMIKLKPLSQVQVAQVLRAENPQITSDELQVLTALCDGRPGLALQYHDAQAVTMYRDLLKVLGRLSSFNYGEALVLSQKYSGKSKSEDNQMDSFVVVGDCLKRFIQKLTRYATVQDTSSILPEEIPVFQQALTIRSALEWANIWGSVNQNFRQSQRFHLDKSQVMFCSLCEIAGVKS
jgi:DNA polymerase-3 subunit delta'